MTDQEIRAAALQAASRVYAAGTEQKLEAILAQFEKYIRDGLKR